MPEDADETLGAMLRTWRTRALLTQEELAARAGLHVRTIRRIERNDPRSPRTVSVRLLADALDLDDRERALFVMAARSTFSPAPAERGPAVAAAPELTLVTAPITVPQQLPANLAPFTGRDAHLRRLDETIATRGTDAANLVVISGAAGVGKTALAVHWAHQAARWYPDGQLYVNLRGFEPSGEPAHPDDVLREFLTGLGVPSDRVPQGEPAQACLFRSLLADKRVLILLDNARDGAQVRPLLPGATGCTTVITSRNQLMSLISADGAAPVPVDLLTKGESRSMLVRRLGAQRVAAEPNAVDKIVSACAQLPLALAIVAARAATHPRFPLATLAAELRKAGASLDVLTTRDDKADVRAAFSWSYRALSAPAARMYRLLGLHPGPDFTAASAASLAGVPVVHARAVLAELSAANLTIAHAPGRYTFHALLRAYAVELAHDHDAVPERDSAMERLLDHYLHTACAAALLLHPQWQGCPPTVLRDGTIPEVLDSYEDALRWFDAERVALRSAAGYAERAGLGDRAWRLGFAFAEYLDRRGLWDDLLDTQRMALEMARRAGDPVREALAHRGISCTYARLGLHKSAQPHHRRAIELYTRLGDRAG